MKHLLINQLCSCPLNKEELEQLLAQLKAVQFNLELFPEEKENLAIKIAELFKEVVNDKFISETRVTFAYENAKKLFECFLSKKEIRRELNELTKLRYNSKVKHLSKKGFVAIDIDGTALLQQIDKNPIYGLLDPRSHLRQVLIILANIAQEQGFDLVVLTARPKFFIETCLKVLNLGAKSTDEVMQLFHQYGIKVSQVLRSPVSPKGNKMQTHLAKYKKHGAEEAVGILLDDQLVQIKDVNGQNTNQLIAYDIISYADLNAFMDQMGEESTKKYPHWTPQAIVQRVIEDLQEDHALKVLCNFLDIMPEGRLRNHCTDIFYNLSIEHFEASYRDYRPQIDWIAITAAKIKDLVQQSIDTTITLPNIENACNSILGRSQASKVKPNSRCFELIKEFFLMISPPPPPSPPNAMMLFALQHPILTMGVIGLLIAAAIIATVFSCGAAPGIALAIGSAVGLSGTTGIAVGAALGGVAAGLIGSASGFFCTRQGKNKQSSSLELSNSSLQPI